MTSWLVGLFAGQGKKGVCVGKNMNYGPRGKQFNSRVVISQVDGLAYFLNGSKAQL